MARRKLKMTKKAIASRRRYRAKKAATVGRPTRKRRKGGNIGSTRVSTLKYPIFAGLGASKPRKRKAKGKGFNIGPRSRKLKGKGFSSKFKGINKGTKWAGQYGKGFLGKAGRKVPMKRGSGLPKGAGFWEDVGGFFEDVGRTALNILPMIL